jgi:hypothetical protein
MSTVLEFIFESTATGGWVPALGSSRHVNGAIASQNAGSINRGLYYQVGGGGMNGRFKKVLNEARKINGTSQLDIANAELKRAYDARYGAGAFDTDAGASSPRSDRLTSFIVKLEPDGAHIGRDVVAMLYSVGPVLGRAGIVDKDGYARIYCDGLKEIAAWNKREATPIQGLRITMLSCGIYADSVDDKDALYDDAAAAIIDGLKRAATDDPGLASVKILINTNDSSEPHNRDGSPHVPTERPAFTAAAQALGVVVGSDGFSVPLDASTD